MAEIEANGIVDQFKSFIVAVDPNPEGDVGPESCRINQNHVLENPLVSFITKCRGRLEQVSSKVHFLNYREYSGKNKYTFSRLEFLSSKVNLPKLLMQKCFQHLKLTLTQLNREIACRCE